MGIKVGSIVKINNDGDMYTNYLNFFDYHNIGHLKNAFIESNKQSYKSSFFNERIKGNSFISIFKGCHETRRREPMIHVLRGITTGDIFLFSERQSDFFTSSLKVIQEPNNDEEFE